MEPIFTVGHSTRSIDEFLAILKAHHIKGIIDVRTIPRSRRHPQFNQEALRESLGQAGIGYRHEPALGGLRKPRADSPNTGWRNQSFRGYADHMQTPAFAEGVSRVIEEAAQRRSALLCAEAVPWKCHRSLLSDALLVRGHAVEDILSATSSKPRLLTPFARVEGTTVTYPESAA